MSTDADTQIGHTSVLITGEDDNNDGFFTPPPGGEAGTNGYAPAWENPDPNHKPPWLPPRCRFRVTPFLQPVLTNSPARFVVHLRAKATSRRFR
jgi:hypothetical protein